MEEELKTLPQSWTQACLLEVGDYLFTPETETLGGSQDIWGMPVMFLLLPIGCTMCTHSSPHSQRGVPSYHDESLPSRFIWPCIMKCLCCFLLKLQICFLWKEATPDTTNKLNLFHLLISTFISLVTSWSKHFVQEAMLRAGCVSSSCHVFSHSLASQHSFHFYFLRVLFPLDAFGDYSGHHM